MEALQKKANAKINLFLDISSKRHDGYHDIISVMQSVSLCDTITVEYIKSHKKHIEITCNDPHVPLGDGNIAYRAADMTVQNGLVKIHIDKKIPMQAGLAGGSTDAAACITTLNEITGNKIPWDTLLSIGSKIGADVPFCMCGGTKLTRGIGNEISDFRPMPDCSIVVAFMGEGVSTPDAYRTLDVIHNNFSSYNPHTEMLDILNTDPSNISRGMYNIFEDVVISKRPAVKFLKDQMNALGAEHAMMSGSGTSVFGIFNSPKTAEHAVHALKEQGAFACVCRPC